jgi:aspartate carbamoyltransferase catalytic subunit
MVTQLKYKKFSHKHLLAIADLSAQEIATIMATAKYFKEIMQRPIKKVPSLRGRTIVNLFFEPSTRTRMSFELAAKRLSADIVNISINTSSIVKGESFKDMAKTIEAMAADMVIIRHSAAGAASYLSTLVNCSVINAGDGAHEHPTQALLDLYTIKEQLGSLKDIRVGIVGDIVHSRVARSNILALNKVGAKVILIGPPTLIPVEVEKLGVEISYDLDSVLPTLDVIYLLRIQKERQGRDKIPSIREYARLYGLNESRVRKLRPNTLILHPGPLNRGVEISAAVADKGNTLITSQVANGIAIRMAVLFLLLEGRVSD